MEEPKEYNAITADKTVSIQTGSVKIETLIGVVLIQSGTDNKGRLTYTAKMIPNRHPNKNKVVVRKTKDSIMLVKCKSSKA